MSSKRGNKTMPKNHLEMQPQDIVKINKDERLVFGWASVVEENGKLVKDTQGDVIPPEVLEKAAYNYVISARMAGERHAKMGVGTLVESMMFTKEKQDALGIDLGKVGWFIGFKMFDDKVWKEIKAGKYPAFSIGGWGKGQPVNNKPEDK
jgi:hypothetical protein